jgi:hypothetical protein
MYLPRVLSDFIWLKNMKATGNTTDTSYKYFSVSYPAGGKTNCRAERVKCRLTAA